MSEILILDKNADPTEDEIREELAGNLRSGVLQHPGRPWGSTTDSKNRAQRLWSDPT
jgi:hypothetical protein